MILKRYKGRSSKKIKRDHSIYKEAKTVFSIYNNRFSHKFGDDLIEKVKMIDIDDEMLDPLKTADYDGFIKMGIQYADAVINGNDENTDSFEKLISEIAKNKRTDTIEKDGDFEESYYNLYNDLVG